jgi:hypothetical protein
MTFETVIHDLQQLIGTKIESIKPGSGITLDEINLKQGRVIITNSSGVKKTRPLNELNLLWNKLIELPAVHVDETLHGSGTSRNQPETIMANLPYIEWFKYNNKKHIAYIGKNTHSLGTKRKMDENNAEILREKLRGNTTDNLNTVIISNEIVSVVQLFIKMTGIKPITLNQDFYKIKYFENTILFISSKVINYSVPEGTYSVIKKPSDFSVIPEFQIENEWYCHKTINGLNLLIKI